jgi:hypothetical protein
MPHLGAFVPSNYFAFIYFPVYSDNSHSFNLIFFSPLPLRDEQSVCACKVALGKGLVDLLCIVPYCYRPVTVTFAYALGPMD